jgi:hypothetical protein
LVLVFPSVISNCGAAISLWRLEFNAPVGIYAENAGIFVRNRLHEPRLSS